MSAKLAGSLILSLSFVAATVLLGIAPSRAQTPDPHAGHHPQSSSPSPSIEPAPPSQSAAPSSPPSALPDTATPSAGMMGMGGCMMCSPAQKQLYPELMAMPVLTPEARQRIEVEARRRIQAANAALVQAHGEYQQAMTRNDPAAMGEAATRQRLAVAELNSGTVALQVVSEDAAPPDIALKWFREQMNLATVATSSERAGPFGLSWFHLISMAGVSVIAVAGLGLAFARNRRSASLMNRLTIAGVDVAPAVAVGPSPSPPVSPQQTGTPLASRPPASPGGVWSGKMRVAAIMRETPHVKTFRLVEPNGGPTPFSFVPGQFLTFSAEVEGKIIGRSYTIASAPSRSSYIEITVKREEEGEFSRVLHDHVSVGATLLVRGPAGHFTFDGGNADSIVLIAGGVGITPMMCVIRYLTDISWPGEIFLVYAARNTEEIIYREELEYLQRRYQGLHVIAAVAERSPGTSWMGLEGQITKDILARSIPDIAKRRVHLCGPPGMMAAIRPILAELAVPEDQIKTEAFGPAMGLVPPPAPLSPPPLPNAIVRAMARLPDGSGAPRLAAGPANATISFARSGKSVSLPPDKTVLEVAEMNGVPIDYSCRVGTCGFCKIKLLAGQVTMEVQEALTEEDKAAGVILACQARSLGDISVDA